MQASISSMVLFSDIIVLFIHVQKMEDSWSNPFLHAFSSKGDIQIYKVFLLFWIFLLEIMLINLLLYFS